MRTANLRTELVRFDKFLTKDITVAVYDAFNLASPFSTLIDTHVLAIRVILTPNPTNDESLSYSISALQLVPNTEMAKVSQEKIQSIRGPRIHLPDATPMPGTITSNLVGIVAYFPEDEKIGARVFSFAVPDLATLDWKRSDGTRMVPSPLGLLKEGRDWQEMLVERSRISAVKIKEGLKGNYPKMTEREWKRWCDNVSDEFGVSRRGGVNLHFGGVGVGAGALNFGWDFVESEGIPQLSVKRFSNLAKYSLL